MDRKSSNPRTRCNFAGFQDKRVREVAWMDLRMPTTTQVARTCNLGKLAQRLDAATPEWRKESVFERSIPRGYDM